MVSVMAMSLTVGPGTSGRHGAHRRNTSFAVTRTAEMRSERMRSFGSREQSASLLHQDHWLFNYEAAMSAREASVCAGAALDGACEFCECRRRNVLIAQVLAASSAREESRSCFGTSR